MFNSKSRQMGVRNQIGNGLTMLEQLLKYGPMSLGRPNYACARLIQPTLYTSNCLFKRERMFEDPRVGCYPNKCRQNRPAQTNNSSPR